MEELCFTTLPRWRGVGVARGYLEALNAYLVTQNVYIKQCLELKTLFNEILFFLSSKNVYTEHFIFVILYILINCTDFLQFHEEVCEIMT
jgi:hypothetical protein